MSQLEQEVYNVFEGIVPKKPVYRLRKGPSYRGSALSLVAATEHTSNVESFIDSIVMEKVDYKVDLKQGVVTKHLRDDAVERVRREMTNDILSFAYNNSGSPNPKLTSFYKWYKNLNDNYNIITRRLDFDERNRFDDLLFNVFKYIRTECGTSEGKENCMKILEFIMQKYENRLRG